MAHDRSDGCPRVKKIHKDMAMDVVYINSKSRWSNNEIKYSLRSLEKYVSGFRDVYIVGFKPSFLSDNIIHKPFEDRFDNKASNIMLKVLEAAKNDDISEDFVLLNDDYFFLNPTSIVDYPHYWKCDLAHTIQIQRNEYQQHVIPTLAELKARGLPTKNFDVHKPIIYNKKAFIDVVQRYDWNRPYGYILRSIYCNTIGIEGVERLDNKINHSHIPDTWSRITKGLDCFSVGDQSTDRYLLSFLNKSTPEPSIYELI